MSNLRSPRRLVHLVGALAALIAQPLYAAQPASPRPSSNVAVSPAPSPAGPAGAGVTAPSAGIEAAKPRASHQPPASLPAASSPPGPVTTVPGLKWDVTVQGEKKGKIPPLAPFPDRYSDVEGVLTFRGNNLRTAPAAGSVAGQPKALKRLWNHHTTAGTVDWGGGAGWTGQPVLVRWPAAVRRTMALKPRYRDKERLVEVIYPSLDGRVYFLDLETGHQTRDALEVKNPTKASCAVDPRGFPILFVGHSIDDRQEFGYPIYSLIDGKRLHFINGRDSWAHRGWGAFDGAPLIHREADEMILCGENGLLYRIALNTSYREGQATLSLKPRAVKYRYRVRGNSNQGIESSVAVWRQTAFFADNGGSVQAVDLSTMQPLWAFRGTDDTDATITIDEEAGKPFIYTGCEVDKQTGTGATYLRKLDGITGKVVWDVKYACQTIRGDFPVNGGLLASPAVGKRSMRGAVVFTLAHCPTINAGLMVALDKATGKEVWRWRMRQYGWSSPVDFYDGSGNMFILQCDSGGGITVLDGKTGKVLTRETVNATIEASPAMLDDTFVVGTRDGHFIGFKVLTEPQAPASAPVAPPPSSSAASKVLTSTVLASPAPRP